MTAALTKVKEVTGQWSSIFPNEVLTEQQSALFVKKLLAVAVSNITYLRAIFPEHAFGDRCIEDLNLKILKDGSSCPGSCRVIEWVKGCFDALDKKYLRMVVIGKVIESYTFKFSYRDNTGIDIYRNDQKIASAYTAEDTRKATIRLLRTVIVLTQTLKSLPDDVWMTMKLLYYDDVTPAEYQPPGFCAAPSDAFSFEEEPANVNVGDVNTNFHRVKIQIKTAKSQFDMEDAEEGDEKCDAQNEGQEGDEGTGGDIVVTEEGLDNDQSPDVNIMETSMDGQGDIYAFNDNAELPTPSAEVPTESPAVPNTNEKAVSQISQNSNIPQAEEDFSVKCPCDCNEDDGLMILCEFCKAWQHGVCFAILKEEDAPTSHVCNECAQANDCLERATDLYLNGMSLMSAQAMCLWRRALYTCLETKAIIAPTFAQRLGVEVTVAQGLMTRLAKEGYIKSSNKGKRHGKSVMADIIQKQGIPKYFKTHTDNEGVREQCESTGPEMELDKLSKKTEEMAIAKVRPRRSGKGRNKKYNESDAPMEPPHRGKKRAIYKLGDSEAPMEQPPRRGKTMEQAVEPPRTVKKRAISKLGDSEAPMEQPVEPARRGKKRAISKLGDGQKFDISNSQDIDAEGDRPKSRKSSMAASAINV